MRASWLLVASLTVIPRAGWPQGEPVGPEFRVNTHISGAQRESSVARDSAGNFMVVWPSQYQDGSSYGVYGQRYASTGAPLGPEFRVNTYTPGIQNVPSVVADGSGNFIAVWAGGQDGSSVGVAGQRYASSGVPLGPEFRINTYTTGAQHTPSVAAGAAGDFVVVWESNTGYLSSSGIFGQRYASSGTPLGPEFRVNMFTMLPQSNPTVASSATGAFVVVWDSYDQDLSCSGIPPYCFGIFGQRYASSGAPLGPQFRVNAYTTAGQYRPAVASDPAGNFVVVWYSESQDGSYGGIFGQRYASSGAPLGEFRVNTFTTSYQRWPSVAVDPSGNFVVVWTSAVGDGSSYAIFGQRYLSSGAPLGVEFRVNMYTTSSQVAPAVATDGMGNFVVTWDSAFQDGDNFGVFGQRYSMIVPVELMQFGVE